MLPHEAQKKRGQRKQRREGIEKEKKGMGTAKENKLTEIAIGLNREIVAMMRDVGVCAEGMEVNLASSLTSSHAPEPVLQTQTPPSGKKKNNTMKKQKGKRKRKEVTVGICPTTT